MTLVLLAVSLAGLLGGCSGGRRTVESGPLGPEARLPVALSLVDLDGKPFNLADGRDKVVLVHYFATWDRGAARRLGKLDDLVGGEDALPSGSLVVLGVCVDRSPKKTLPAFVDAAQLSIPIALASAETMARGQTPFGPLRAVPTTFLVDPLGRLSERIDGPAPLEYTRRRIVALLEESR